MPSEPRGSLRSKSVTLPYEDQEAMVKTGKRKTRPYDFESASRSRYDDATLLKEACSRRVRQEMMRLLPTDCQEPSRHVGKGKKILSQGQNVTSLDRNQTYTKSIGTKHGHGTSSVRTSHVVETSVPKASGYISDKMPSRGVELERMRLLRKQCQTASGPVKKGNTNVHQGPSGGNHGHDSISLHPIKSTPHPPNAFGTSAVENSKASGSKLSRKDRVSFSHGEQPPLTVAHSPANSLDGNTISPAKYRHEAADSLEEFSRSSEEDNHWPANSLDESSTTAATDSHWPANSLHENSKSSGLSDSSQERGSPSPKVTTLRQWVHGLETSVDQGPTSQGKKRSTQTRGISTGAKWEKEVKKNGKYKISFLPGETVATENNSDLSSAIGIIVKTGAELQGVSSWKEVSESNKKYCYTKLFRWFDIEDWSTERVYKIVDKKFQSAYTRWRSALNQIYSKLLDEGINPRDVCPRQDLDMIRWHAACDFIEDEKFQKRSQTNKQNRKKMLFTHTTGRIPILCRYKNMKEKNKIELFRITRTCKDGEFVNPLAQATYEEMVKMQQEAQEAGAEISEEAIMRSKLGVRCGYVKGMGHGVEVNHSGENCTESITELIEENLSEVTNTKEKVSNLEGMIANLQVQMRKMEKFVKQIAGIPSYNSQDLDDLEEEDHAENDEAGDNENELDKEAS